MRRLISFFIAVIMTAAGGYFAVTLAAHMMHWVVIVSAGLCVIGLLWLWEDFGRPIFRRARAGAAGRTAQTPDDGMKRAAI